MALVIHTEIRNNTSVKILDTARYYTMVREKGDVDLAKSFLENELTWLSTECRANFTKTASLVNSSDTCILQRAALRDNILNSMKCATYNSQVCSYLRNITAALVTNKTISATLTTVCKDLRGTVPNRGTLTYRELLRNAVINAPLLFHNSYRAAQSDDFYVLRTILYNNIILGLLGNILVHYIDEYRIKSWGSRLLMRILVFIAASFVGNFLFLIGNWGSALTIAVGIWLPSLLILFYYEAFLDHTIVRPWVHPYTFCTIYTSLCILALTENGVLNASIIGLSVVQAQAISLVYMQIVWYWVGYKEKLRVNLEGEEPFATPATHAANIYLTKEVQFALFAGLVAMAGIPICQTIGPFDYNTTDLLTIQCAPLLFIVISVIGTIYLQSLHLDDDYGRDKVEVPPDLTTPKEKLIWGATRITGGKLAVSLLLLVFVALYELNLVGEYFRGLRAYQDKLPTRAWQFDIASTYTIGTGFLPVAANFP